MTTKFLNCTPHKINLNDGRSFEPVLTNPIRVSAQFGEINGDICSQSFGDIVLKHRALPGLLNDQDRTLKRTR